MTQMRSGADDTSSEMMGVKFEITKNYWTFPVESLRSSLLPIWRWASAGATLASGGFRVSKVSGLKVPWIYIVNK